MAYLGTISLYIALVLATYSAAGSFWGRYRGNPELVESARHAAYLTVLALAMATVSLIAAFVTRDFGIQYVYLHSNRAMDPIYTWVALYAGNEGSLLFIAFVLSIMSSIAVVRAPKTTRSLLPYATGVLMLVLTFFVAVMLSLANPFAPLPFAATDGQGMNPLLTHPGMFFHPPMLMTGLIATALPFSFAMGALLARSTGDEWIASGRTWGIIAWATLGIGNLLGAWWAYTILGWGGYWAWDPIENAGFMPWLALTAFIHSIMVQKRRGMFRMWNMVLIIIAFGLAQFGMFLNRGGPVVSVHSFAESILGWVFLSFMAFTLLGSLALFFYRYSSLKSAQPLQSVLSREVAFLVNNLLLLAIAFVTMWGVVFPLISQVFQGVTVTVGEPFYNQVNGPLFLALIFLMGVAPLLPWRQVSLAGLRKALLVPGLAAIGTVALLAAIGMREPYPLAAFGLCALVASSIVREWVRGTRSRHRKGENYVTAFLGLIAANRPRYGGYVVHLAIIMLALGIVGSSFYNTQQDVILSPGESAIVGNYEIRYIDASTTQKSDRTEFVTRLSVYNGGNPLGTMATRRTFYPGFDMASTRAAIRSTPVEDLYIVNSEFLDNNQAVFRILVNPLIMWMWIAGPVLLLGTMISLWPQRKVSTTYVRTPRDVASTHIEVSGRSQ